MESNIRLGFFLYPWALKHHNCKLRFYSFKKKHPKLQSFHFFFVLRVCILNKCTVSVSVPLVKLSLHVT